MAPVKNNTEKPIIVSKSENESSIQKVFLSSKSNYRTRFPLNVTLF